jgi:hypothetical protein
VFAPAISVLGPSFPDLTTKVQVAVVIDVTHNHIVPTELSVENNPLDEFAASAVHILKDIPTRWCARGKNGRVLLFGRENIIVTVTIKVRDGERME